MALHNQILVNGVSDNPPTGEQELIQWLRELVDFIDMKIVMGPMAFYVTKEGNRGITGIVGIETSHIAVHVWDEPNPALIQFDLYTCSTLPVDKVLEKLEKDLGLRDYKYMLIEREREFNILDQGAKS